ncbi:unnamed protein product [Dibothriocephalus latus]|uniref:Sex-determining region Y protein n=1 Tax=Dibothriocephalus latus TaxID=60516 RepID=A0A3P7LLF3_DIBLA|nr:unnamed protein product [Dibothriocephalus latus]
MLSLNPAGNINASLNHNPYLNLTSYLTLTSIFQQFNPALILVRNFVFTEIWSKVTCLLFAQHIRRNILQTFDGVSNVDLSRHLGELWSTLPQTLKTQFDEESARLSRLHQLEFPNYKYQPNKRVQTVISATVVRSLSGSGGLDKPTRINLPPLTIKKATSTLPDSAYVSSGELSPSPYLSDPPPVAASPKKHPVIRSCYSTAPKRPPTSDCGDCGFDEFCTSPQPPPRQRFMSAGNGAPSTMYQRPPLRSASCYPLPRSECLSKAWQPSPASRRETMVPVLVVRGSNVEEFSMTIPLEEEKEATRIETSAMPAVMSSQEEFVLRPPKTEMLKDNNGEEEEQEEEGRDLKPAFWTDSVKQTEWPFVGDAHLLPIETAKEEVEEEDEGPLNLDSLLDECYQREELTTDVGSNSFLQLTASPLSELLTADRDSFDFCQALLSDGGTPSPVLA